MTFFQIIAFRANNSLYARLPDPSFLAIEGCGTRDYVVPSPLLVPAARVIKGSHFLIPIMFMYELPIKVITILAGQPLHNRGRVWCPALRALFPRQITSCHV